MAFQCTSALVTLAATDFELIIRFYAQLLRQEPQPYLLNVYAEFQLPSLRLGIFRPQATHLVEFENSSKSAMSLCLEVNDLEGVISHLNTLGFPPPGEITTASHGREIYAYDPEGNRLIIHQAR
ncbi:VOC family protein [Lyngbya aestuarii]|uniref:VOC family protein n=1 Tax=Lyngbya aestuarii TaxID=118322 RepID=UPI00403DFB57